MIKTEEVFFLGYSYGIFLESKILVRFLNDLVTAFYMTNNNILFQTPLLVAMYTCKYRISVYLS